MKKIIISILTAIFFNNLIFSQEDGVLFRFKHKLNDSTKILSCVDEKVYLNNRFVNHAKIINRITSTVTEESEDGSGTVEANFMTTETNSSVYNQTNAFRGLQREDGSPSSGKKQDHLRFPHRLPGAGRCSQRLWQGPRLPA